MKVLFYNIFIYKHKHSEQELREILVQTFEQLSPEDKEKAMRLILELKL